MILFTYEIATCLYNIMKTSLSLCTMQISIYTCVSFWVSIYFENIVLPNIHFIFIKNFLGSKEKCVSPETKWREQREYYIQIYILIYNLKIKVLPSTGCNCIQSFNLSPIMLKKTHIYQKSFLEISNNYDLFQTLILCKDVIFKWDKTWNKHIFWTVCIWFYHQSCFLNTISLKIP